MVAVPSETPFAAPLPAEADDEETTVEFPQFPSVSLGDILGINTAISVLFCVGSALGFGQGFGWLLLLPVLMFGGLLLVQLPFFLVIGYYGGLFHAPNQGETTVHAEQFLPRFEEHSAMFRASE